MGSLATDAFVVRDTHGILLRQGVDIWASSDRLRWSSLYASTQREQPFEDHFRPVEDQLIVLHLDGPVTVERAVGTEQGCRVIAPGGLHMVPGGLDFGVRLGGELSTIHLYLRRALIMEVAAEILPGDPARLQFIPRFGEADPLLENLILGVRDALYDDDPTARPYTDYLARTIAARLIRAHSNAVKSSPPKSTNARFGRAGLADTIEFMQAHLERPLELADIADAVGLSPSQFARRFRASTGVAPHQYLMRLRAERAARFLVETETPVAEIASACGFSHQEHLTRIFKRILGTTPAAYRKHRRG